MRTNYIKDFVTRLNNDHKARTSQPMPSVVPQSFSFRKPTIFLVQKESLFVEDLNNSKFKEPRISLPKTFDGTYSKFRGFVNQIQFIMFLQLQSMLPNRRVTCGLN